MLSQASALHSTLMLMKTAGGVAYSNQCTLPFSGSTSTSGFTSAKEHTRENLCRFSHVPSLLFRPHGMKNIDTSITAREIVTKKCGGSRNKQKIGIKKNLDQLFQQFVYSKWFICVILHFITRSVCTRTADAEIFYNYAIIMIGGFVSTISKAWIGEPENCYF